MTCNRQKINKKEKKKKKKTTKKNKKKRKKQNKTKQKKKQHLYPWTLEISGKRRSFYQEYSIHGHSDI